MNQWDATLGSHGQQILGSTQALAEVFRLPEFAPLSASMVLWLLSETVETVTQQTRRDIQRVVHQFETLLPKVQHARNLVWQTVSSKATTNDLAIKDFQAIFTDRITPLKLAEGKTYHASRPTLMAWRRTGVLRGSQAEERGTLDADSASSILIAALVDKRVQGFLPPEKDPQEAWWWAWGQVPPQEGHHFPPFPVPIPLPQDLPAGTLLWSPWPTFDPLWRQFSNVGAMRFKEAKLRNGELIWLIQRKDLARWDPDLINLSREGIFGDWFTTRQIHQFAETTLYRLAPRYLLPS